MAKTIKVMAGKVDNRTIMWETHPDHPGGEAFISADGTAVEVAETTRVAALIKDGTLVKVEKAAAKAAADQAAADAKAEADKAESAAKVEAAKAEANAKAEAVKATAKAEADAKAAAAKKDKSA
jgi:hypothetical protein